MNPLLQGHSGITQEPSGNALRASQGTKEEDSQNDPHPEAGLFHGQKAQNSGPEDDHDTVTGATEQIGNCHDLTGVHEEVSYCSPNTSSGKLKKTALPVNRKSPARTPLQQSKQTKFFGPSAVGK